MFKRYKRPGSYSRDPRWLDVKYACKCSKCGKEIAKGSQGFYYYSDRTMLCDSENCGKQASRDFQSACYDEAGICGFID